MKLEELLDLIERSTTWDEETLRHADPLFQLLRARVFAALERGGNSRKEQSI